jgi:hypothetical protein
MTNTEYVNYKEYATFTNLLHRLNIPYCMDSGVLLAIMREGKIFENEKDIDIQMWEKNVSKFISIIPELNSMGYKITIWKYRGLIYQFRLKRKNNIPIHIMIFRKKGSWAWCPAGRAKVEPFSLKFMKLVYAPFAIARRKLRNKLVSTDVAYWPWRVRRDLGTWWIPAEFFEESVFIDTHNMYIPKKWDDYLKYRYGNWRFPDKTWNFWLDDGAIKHKKPEELVNIMEYKRVI